MMSKEESDIVKSVYTRFLESEEESTWTEIDENLEFYGYLSDEEVIKEAKIKFEEHSSGVFRCKNEHDIKFCFAPKILEAVEYILNLYDETGFLHEKNRYVILYYLVMSILRMIYSQ
jgi:hypothetical protein